MRIFDTDVQKLKYDILREVARYAYEDRLLGHRRPQRPPLGHTKALPLLGCGPAAAPTPHLFDSPSDQPSYVARPDLTGPVPTRYSANFEKCCNFC